MGRASQAVPFLRLACALACVSACAKEGAAPAVASGESAQPVAAQAEVEPDHGPPQQIECGDYHSCARMQDGTVRCWGRGQSGELGDGGGRERTKAIGVPGVHEAVSIALGANFSCALVKGGTVQCWGTGAILNDSAIREHLAPTQVPGIEGAIEIEAGGLMACVRFESGSIKCWGESAEQPGKDVTKASEISVAEVHACARLMSGSVRCWGESPWSKELRVPKISDAQQITTGDNVACAVVKNGDVRCWGRNEQAQMGAKADTDVHPSPRAVAGVSKARRVIAGEAHVCAIVSDGTLRCWGSNTDGELGRGSVSPSELAGAVSELRDVADISLGADHACARTTDGTAWCWGSNAHGQLGDGTKERRTTPVRVVW